MGIPKMFVWLVYRFEEVEGKTYEMKRVPDTDPHAGRPRAGGGRDGVGHIAGEACDGLPAVRPRSLTADPRAGILKGIRKKTLGGFG